MMAQGGDTASRRRDAPPPVFPDNPFGLSKTELYAEIDRLLDAGWMPWELRERFTSGPQVVAA